MYALLGDVQFDLTAYFEGMDGKFGVDYAEHAVIEGKPRLQRIANKLDEFTIAVKLHQYYCNPEVELAKLVKSMNSYQAQAFILGNGDYKGWFVVSAIDVSSKQTTPDGTLMEVDANLTLREYVGDKMNPLPPPAIKPKQPPVAAKSVAESLPITSSEVSAAREAIRDTVKLANQAGSAMRLASDAVRVAQKLADNPIAALGQVSSLLTNAKQIAEPLAKLSPTLAGLTDQLPAAATILRASNSALGAVRNGQYALSKVNAGSVMGGINYLSGQLDVASNAMQAAAPSISKLAGQIVTRKI